MNHPQQVWRMDREQKIKRLSEEEVAKLPAFVLETLAFDTLAMFDCTLYGNSPEQLKGDDGLFANATIEE